MAHGDDDPAPANKPPGPYLMDGTGSSQSYAVVARRGDIFLDIRFAGLSDGAQLGLPGKTYLHVRLRSARNPELAAQLDLASGPENVFNLFQPQITLDAAWPDLAFEKLDAGRASLSVGLFIRGSLSENAAAVLARLRQGDVFRQLAAYAVAHAGAEHCIAEQERVALWLAKQAKPTLHELRKKIVVDQAMAATREEFEARIDAEEEVVAPHRQDVKAIFQRHVQEHLLALTISERRGRPHEAE